jgi:hypothetical protein
VSGKDECRQIIAIKVKDGKLKNVTFSVYVCHETLHSFSAVTCGTDVSSVFIFVLLCAPLGRFKVPVYVYSSTFVVTFSSGWTKGGYRTDVREARRGGQIALDSYLKMNCTGLNIIFAFIMTT